MKIGLGTVQFGLPYGIANSAGLVTPSTAAEILDLARTSGIDTLDTAISYGTAEETLGGIGVRQFRLVTKLPGMEGLDARRLVEGSLARLGLDRVHGLLLHRPDDLLSSEGDRLHETMLGLKSEGLVGKIGISIYDPEELDRLYDRFRPDLVQAPYNILDRGIETSGWLSRLRQDGVEVHTRSAFLQGLLLMPEGEQVQRFPAWAGVWRALAAWLHRTGQSPVEAALGFALGHPDIERVIVGVDGLEHLKQLVKIGSRAPVLADDITRRLPDELNVSDKALINPANWKRT